MALEIFFKPIAMTNFVEKQQYESSSEADDEMEMDQQDIQEKTTVKRNFDSIKDKSFINRMTVELNFLLIHFCICT
jgi:hypothetical protein